MKKIQVSSARVGWLPLAVTVALVWGGMIGQVAAQGPPAEMPTMPPMPPGSSLSLPGLPKLPEMPALATPGGQPTPTDRVEFHMKEAVKALGEAGAQAYRENLPEILDSTRKAVEQTKRLLQDWETKLGSQSQPSGMGSGSGYAPAMPPSPPPLILPPPGYGQAAPGFGQQAPGFGQPPSGGQWFGSPPGNGQGGPPRGERRPGWQQQPDSQGFGPPPPRQTYL